MLGKDTAEGIATELVGAGLVDGRDIVAIAANLEKLISSNGEMRQVTFPLVSVQSLLSARFMVLTAVSWVKSSRQCNSIPCRSVQAILKNHSSCNNRNRQISLI